MSITLQTVQNEQVYSAQRLQSVSSEIMASETQEIDGMEKGTETPSSPAPTQPLFDEYIKGSGQEKAPGLYEIKPDKEKGYEISYNPYTEDEVPAGESAVSPAEEAAPADDKEVSSEEKKQEESETTVNTDRVDAEIKSLKREILSIEQQIDRAEHSGKSEQEIELLKKHLASIEEELEYKGTDTYRRQHAVYL